MRDADDAAFLQDTGADLDKPEDALQSFAAENESSSGTKQALDAFRGGAAAAIGFLRRNSWLAVVAVSAASLAASVLLINFLFGSATPSTSASSPAAASAESSDATPPNAPPGTASKKAQPPATKAVATRTGSGLVARNEQPRSGSTENAAVLLPKVSAARPQDERSTVRAPLATEIAAPVVASSSDVVSTAIDETIYSAEDRDVVPPQTEESLPGPTISRWTTRTNAMEVIVSNAGSVERVRLLTPPQRMPDVLVLSRAKVWKFTPALKDGQPVRYRLVLTWEVNP